MIRIACAMLLLAAGETADIGGLVLQAGDSPSERLNPTALYSPGAPPLLSFRYFDASDRGRFGNLGLMTDDAGH
jgi:hypothetical protein